MRNLTKIFRVEVVMFHAEKRAEMYNEATRNKQDRRTLMPLVGFEPAILAFERPQTARSLGSTPTFKQLHNLETTLKIMVA